MSGFCDYGNETLGSIKCWEYLDQLRNPTVERTIPYPYIARIALGSSEAFQSIYRTSRRQTSEHRNSVMVSIVAGSLQPSNSALILVSGVFDTQEVSGNF